MKAKPRTAVDEEAITWAFRLLVGREPVDANEVGRHTKLPDMDHLRLAFASTWEFQDFFDRVGFGRPHYRMPMFLMRPPTDPAIPFAFTPPDLDRVTCQMATHLQYSDPVYAEIIEAMNLKHEASRWQWEQVWIVSVLATAGLIGLGRRILGLDIGNQRLPALLASRGVEVMVADPPTPTEDLERRRLIRASDLFHPEIVNFDDFGRLLRWEMFGPETLPAELHGMFDAVWSTGVIEQLGPRERAMAAIKDTLACLKPGGIAAHSVVLNIASDTMAPNRPDYAVFRRSDIEALAQELRAEGHSIETLNFHPGLAPEDDEVFSGPGSQQRPKWRHGAHVLTTFGLVIRKCP